MGHCGDLRYNVELLMREKAALEELYTVRETLNDLPPAYMAEAQNVLKAVEEMGVGVKRAVRELTPISAIVLVRELSGLTLIQSKIAAEIVREGDE